MNEDAPQPRGAKPSGLPPGLESPLRGESIVPGAGPHVSPTFAERIFKAALQNVDRSPDSRRFTQNISSRLRTSNSLTTYPGRIVFAISQIATPAISRPEAPARRSMSSGSPERIVLPDSRSDSPFLIVTTFVRVADDPDGAPTFRKRDPSELPKAGQNMNWVSVDSRAFAALADRRGERRLYVRFHSGKIYRYFDFRLICMRSCWRPTRKAPILPRRGHSSIG
jgi:hypothetical protein